jgi:hypothetical protein
MHGDDHLEQNMRIPDGTDSRVEYGHSGIKMHGN